MKKRRKDREREERREERERIREWMKANDFFFLAVDNLD